MMTLNKHLALLSGAFLLAVTFLVLSTPRGKPNSRSSTGQMLKRLLEKANNIVKSERRTANTIESEDVRKQAMHYSGRIAGMLKGIGRSSEGTESHIPKNDDIILNTFPKAGTAIMQQLLYQCCVFSGGAPADDPTGMEFDDIATAVPWIEKMKSLGMWPPKTNPRIYKSHKYVTVYPRGASKHIVIARDPSSFVGSFLNFIFFNINPDLDEATMSDDLKRECVNVLNEFIVSPVSPSIPYGPWHCFLKDAYGENTSYILILFYEDVVKDIDATIRRVVKFMDRPVAEEHIATIAQRCNQEYMSKDPKFDGHFEQEKMGFKNKVFHTYPKGYKGFKQFGMTNEARTKLDDMNEEAFGVRTYDELRQKINAEQLKLHGF